MLAHRLEQAKIGPTDDDIKVNTLEMTIFKLKSKLGEIMNATFEFGSPELLDIIESIMSAKDTSGSITGYISQMTFGVEV